MKLGKYSLGIGDRFAHQATAQLQALLMAKEADVTLTPVWNKSFREHKIIGSEPGQTREQADRAVQALQWTDAYFVDADHINLKNVDYFLDSSDFFTIDVADFIGKQGDREAIDQFIQKCVSFTGSITLPIINKRLDISKSVIQSVAFKYISAVQQAHKIYQHILIKKGNTPFIVEVSMDETEEPQSPHELFLILFALSHYKIPLQTIAPKFSGRFNKGIDYIGNLDRFSKEFEQDCSVVNLAVSEFGLPRGLKLSVHSGSYKFSLYPVIREVIKRYNAGLHVKTAGTTWLEELAGLAESGGSGLALAKKIYRESLTRFDELCAPYASVIDIDKEQLPSAEEVESWEGAAYTGALRHDQANPAYNKHFRQLLHVGYKIAAGMGNVYLDALTENETIIAKNVTGNIFDRHIKPLFL